MEIFTSTETIVGGSFEITLIVLKGSDHVIGTKGNFRLNRNLIMILSKIENIL